MTTDPLADLLRYRLEQSEEALQEARLLQEAGHLRASVNRAYYSMFYAVQALLVKGGLGTSKHSGTISLFDREFVRTGLFDRQFSKWIHQTFDLRQDADYGTVMQIKEEMVCEALRQAEAFAARVKEFLE